MFWLSMPTIFTSVFVLLDAICIQSSLGHPPPPPVSKEIVPTKSWVRKSCNLEVYSILFNEQLSSRTQANGTALISLLRSGTFLFNGTSLNYFGDYLDQLCLSIDENKVVDMHLLDCISDIPGVIEGADADASCECGFDMNSYDPNVPQPETDHGSLRTYSVTKGLDRKLTLENNTCVSGYRGHCNMTVPIPLKCASNLHCQPLYVKGRYFQNKNNSNVYGFCDRAGVGLSQDLNMTFKTSRANMGLGTHRELLLIAITLLTHGRMVGISTVPFH